MTLIASKSGLPGSDQSDTDQKQVICRNADSFHAAAQNCFITVLRINVNVMRPILFSILMKESSPLATNFHRFFDKLAVTQGKLTFDLFRNVPFAIESPRFWNLEAVRHCQWLEVDHIRLQMELPFSAATALQWLAISPSTLSYKRLYVHQSMLSESLEQFCIGVYTEFANASFRFRSSNEPVPDPHPPTEKGSRPHGAARECHR